MGCVKGIMFHITKKREGNGSPNPSFGKPSQAKRRKRKEERRVLPLATSFSPSPSMEQTSKRTAANYFVKPSTGVNSERIQVHNTTIT
jgi:hypothetical protein